MNLKVAISPCPNDTFIFGAIAQQWVNTPPFTFDFSYYDINILNELAKKNEFDLIKVSYVQALKLRKNYHILSSGGAMGYGCGPLLISLNKSSSLMFENSKIGIPGLNTTACFLLNFFNPTLKNLIILPFDQIEEAIIAKKIDYGVIIHESRFTYQDKGLECIQDLGEYWENKTFSPIPLGCILLNKKYDLKDFALINDYIKKSLTFAQHNPKSLEPFFMRHAQTLTLEVAKSHISLYVNEFSFDVGKKGEIAIQLLENYLLEKH